MSGSDAMQQRAVGTCANRRRRQGAARPEWVRPYRRAQRALDSSVSLIFSLVTAAGDASRCAKRHPVRTARRLTRGVRQMAVAQLRLVDAQRQLAVAGECLSRAPEQLRGEAPELLDLAAERCESVAKYIGLAVTEAVVAQMDVLARLATGELDTQRPRILIKPRPTPVRDFLDRRQPRVADRISHILRRRRRTPRPAALRVPRRSIRGRAPPCSSTCLL